MSDRSASSALALVALLAPLAASAEMTATDAAGRTLRFAAPPERMVALHNDAFGQMAADGDRPVATLVIPDMAADGECYFPEDAEIS